jgi:hypothetical protein
LRAGRSTSNRLVVAIALALSAIVVAAAWLLWPHGAAPDGAVSVAADVMPPPPAAAPPPMVARPAQRPAAPAPPPAHEPDDSDPHPPGAHAHPITDKHRRIAAENRIAFALDDATDAKDVAVMKELLAQYRREFPEDQWQLQSGYAMVIECLEHPGAESRRAAERWLDQNNGSTVKRSVLRNCIDPPQP